MGVNEDLAEFAYAGAGRKKLEFGPLTARYLANYLEEAGYKDAAEHIRTEFERELTDQEIDDCRDVLFAVVEKLDEDPRFANKIGVSEEEGGTVAVRLVFLPDKDGKYLQEG